MNESNNRGPAGGERGDGSNEAGGYRVPDPAGQSPLPVYRPEQDASYQGASAADSTQGPDGHGTHQDPSGQNRVQDEVDGSWRGNADQGGLPAGSHRGRGGQSNGHSGSGPISAMAICGMVLGILALIFSFIPIINNLAFFLGILGLIFALVGIHATGRRGSKKGRGLSIAGVVICVLAMVITLVMQMGFSKAGDSFRTPEKKTTTSQSAEISKDAPKKDDKDKTKTITLKASSTGSGSVTYGPAGSSSQEKFEGSWQKDITGESAKQMHSLTVMGDLMNQDSNQKLTCDVLVDGVSKDHKEATGSGAVVTCSSPMF